MFDGTHISENSSTLQTPDPKTKASCAARSWARGDSTARLTITTTPTTRIIDHVTLQKLSNQLWSKRGKALSARNDPGLPSRPFVPSQYPSRCSNLYSRSFPSAPLQVAMSACSLRAKFEGLNSIQMCMGTLSICKPGLRAHEGMPYTCRLPQLAW